MYTIELCPYAAPPKVAEKPVRVDPDKLSFKEKLALHNRTLEEQGGSAVKPVIRPSSSQGGYRRPITPELAVSRASEQATSPNNTTPKGSHSIICRLVATTSTCFFVVYCRVYFTNLDR